MTIRNVLFAMLLTAIVSLGLALTGCNMHAHEEEHPAAEHPAAEHPTEQPK